MMNADTDDTEDKPKSNIHVGTASTHTCRAKNIQVMCTPIFQLADHNSLHLVLPCPTQVTWKTADPKVFMAKLHIPPPKAAILKKHLPKKE